MIRSCIIVLLVVTFVSCTVNSDDDDIVRMTKSDAVDASASTPIVHNDSYYGGKSLYEFKEEMLRQAQRQEKHPLRNITRKLEKDRFNFASFDCGAKILGASSEAEHASAILTEDRDKYLLTPCNAVKWVVLALCEEILTETIAIANFEFYSSMFKDFQVLGSQTYPTEQWAVLGTFRAKNQREVQEFELTRPAWVRYIKLRFITHHGSEYICPVSLVRVHGNTALHAMKEELEMSRLQMQDVDTALHQRELDQDANGNSATTATNETPVDASTVTVPLVNIAVDVPDESAQSTDTVVEPVLAVNNSNAAVVIIAPQISVNVSSTVNGNGTVVAAALNNATAVVAAVSSNATAAGNRTEGEKLAHQETHENIFKTVTAKIKSLEMNMTLSNAFLELLNKRLGQEVANLTAQVTAGNALTAEAVSNITCLFDELTAVQMQLLAMQQQTQQDLAAAWWERWWWRVVLVLYCVATWYVYKQTQLHHGRMRMSKELSPGFLLASVEPTAVTSTSEQSAVASTVSTGPPVRRKRRSGSAQFSSVPETPVRSISH
eukprot:TRINITY_DN3208_c0_g1_i3.p2 TRINITY_DN3208_c0_g1~~TRINITY_DN3208_c0_g1_i3.p2  ORF type:complete len:549 (+),score=111.34 TRINITY_DN3208_c0_g1_i3:3079-4725(+)